MKFTYVLLVVSVGVTLTQQDEVPVVRAIRQARFPPRSQGGVGASGFRGAVSGCDCAPISACPQGLDQLQGACQLPEGVPGVCCPPVASAAAAGRRTAVTRTLPNVRPRVSTLPNVAAFNSLASEGQAAVTRIKGVEESLNRRGLFLQPNTPAAQHRYHFILNSRARQMHRNALAVAFTVQRMGGSSASQAFDLRGTSVENTCPAVPRCDRSARYRTTDGSCNNLNNPAFGQVNTPVQRILEATYDDGVLTPRNRSVDGSALPNPRVISNNVLVDVDNPDQTFTSSVMQWAQFLDHDFAHSPFPDMENGEPIQCCPNGQVAVGEDRHPFCIPIDTTGDLFYGPRGRACMNVIRSMFTLDPQCTFGTAEQINTLTHWIDGSNVYGSDQEEQDSIRLRRDGLLKTQGNNFLPFDPRREGGECAATSRGARCLLAGESRVNEQPGLTAMHVLWMREHNRVVRDLKAVNPRGTDEELFQEGRRIVVAEMQHIAYNEWLPIIVGPGFIQSFGIGALRSGFSSDYNPNINPNMNNEFSTAAFRFGHTLVQGTLRLFGADGSASSIQLRDHFNSPHLIQQQGRLDQIVRSLTQLAIQSYDPFITQDLSNHLFQTPRFNFGMDLMSLNIHRGRDHGISTYNAIRQVCGLSRARNFQDLTDQIPIQVVRNLARVYKSVDDIDFFVGGISERPVSGGLLGWTFLCVVGDQFARLRNGDRFFYDLGGQPHSFTEPQLQEIRRTSWARIICDNSDNIEAVQPLAFRLPDRGFNRQLPCRSPQIPRPNLQVWGARRG